ncbi:uncharacterized protein LOC116005890 [Ipomoea triloba]|uniref:uncharacterized protein LOC116005890 n=1 Tax=Ipomoea triloba TaxID=35885 RepID=UPI00125D2816|nr:uncharacterized protein LOC116005890 [Ipomoea triloba]
MNAHYPQDLQIPLAHTYSGRYDPQEHIDMYYGNMLMLGVSDAVICRAFFATLVGKAAEWFKDLERGSIRNFGQLADKFVKRFAASKSRKKSYTCLNKVNQAVGEPLSTFLFRWEREVDEVEPMEDQVAIQAFLASLCSGALYYDLIVNPPRTYEEAITRAKHHADATEANMAKRRDEQPANRDRGHDQRKNKPPFKHVKQHNRPDDVPRFTPLNRPLVDVLQFAEQCNLIHPLEPVPEGEDKSKYCAFHRVKGHNTSECMALRMLIEQLIQNGELGQFVMKGDRNKGKTERNVWKRNPEKNNKAFVPPGSADEKAVGKKPVIHVIYGGPEGGDSSRQRKQWARNSYVGTIHSEPREKKKYVGTIHSEPREKKKRTEPISFTPREKKKRTEPISFTDDDQKKRTEPISFTDDDLPLHAEPISFTDDDLPLHGEAQNDPLVITLDVSGTDVQRVLVDTGSSVNILYFDVFTQLGLSTDRLTPIRTPLSGFTGDSIEAEGVIRLDVELGSQPNVLKTTMDFVVVKLKCVHNAILGRPGITRAAAVISMSHLCMKFYTPNGIGVARGDQRAARQCYVRAVKQSDREESRIHTISQQVDHGELKEKPQPASELEEIILDSDRPERVVKIGRGLPVDLREDIVGVLQRYKNVFAWGPEDMPGVDRSVICHRLSIQPGSKPVKQKKRHLSSERREFVKKETATLLAVGHVREVLYPEWLANVVLVPEGSISLTKSRPDG